MILDAFRESSSYSRARATVLLRKKGPQLCVDMLKIFLRFSSASVFYMRVFDVFDSRKSFVCCFCLLSRTCPLFDFWFFHFDETDDTEPATRRAATLLTITDVSTL